MCFSVRVIARRYCLRVLGRVGRLLRYFVSGLRPRYPLIPQSESRGADSRDNPRVGEPTAETIRESEYILLKICLRFWKRLLIKTTPKTTCLKCRGLLPRPCQVIRRTIYRHIFISHFRLAFKTVLSVWTAWAPPPTSRQSRLRQAETKYII